MVKLRTFLLAPVALVAASPLTARQTAESDTFQMYAYGEGIGGIPLFAAGEGELYIGTPDGTNLTDTARVIFTLGSDSSLQGNPNTTDLSTTPSWANLTFAIPLSASSDRSVTLVSGTNDTSSTTTGFMLFGSYVLVQEGDEAAEALWYAVPSGMDDVYSLSWNVTTDASDGVPLSLRTIPPSNES